MRSCIYYLLALVLVLIIGCGTHSPIETPTIRDGTTDYGLPTFEIGPVDGLFYTVDMNIVLDAMRADRTCQDIDPGTDMTPDELRQFFAVNIVHTTFPGMWECTIYKYYMVPFLDAMPDTTMYEWVEVFEWNGVDIPNADPAVPIPPDPIC